MNLSYSAECFISVHDQPSHEILYSFYPPAPSPCLSRRPCPKIRSAMSNVELLLALVAALLFLIWLRLGAIASRLKEQFPSEKEQDADWAQKDPMGHWEAHRKDK